MDMAMASNDISSDESENRGEKRQQQRHHRRRRQWRKWQQRNGIGGISIARKTEISGEEAIWS